MSATEKGISDFFSDDKGVRTYNEYFGIGVNLYNGGSFESEKNGQKQTVQFKAGQKITLSNQYLKMSACQMLFLRDVLNTPAFLAELKARVKKEREQAALQYAVLGD